MIRVKIILGTRPEAIKLIPVFMAMKANGVFDVRLISTGQHRKMLDQIFDFFEIKPDLDLNLMSHNQTLAKFTSIAFSSIDAIVKQDETDLIVVQGDTTTSMVASMVAFYTKIKIGHVEAGLRTYEKFSPFPEEINRRIISLVADFNFAPTKYAAESLIEEKCVDVFVTGNTVIDSLLLGLGKVNLNIEKYRLKYGGIVKSNKFNVLVTGHRRESFGQSFEQICDSIAELSARYVDYNFIYPVHLNPNVRDIVFRKLEGIENVFLIDPVSYDDMIFLMDNSKIILTDSGGIQEEAPSLNVPVVVMREHTERMEGVNAGCSVLSGTSHKIVEDTIRILDDKKLYEDMAGSLNPFGDGESSQKICKIIIENMI